jgi:hypothetical protein
MFNGDVSGDSFLIVDHVDPSGELRQRGYTGSDRGSSPVQYCSLYCSRICYNKCAHVPRGKRDCSFIAQRLDLTEEICFLQERDRLLRVIVCLLCRFVLSRTPGMAYRLTRSSYGPLVASLPLTPL